ncbi:MAG: UDP-N-acetylmuramoyl-L-alanine--D-glutamate ligase [Patescibacteria group bacterium]|nr:UDP-N-acetylmuramoyl-L-alanine--D-glutamate ligase [Patescibacteria group bacterium]
MGFDLKNKKVTIMGLGLQGSGVSAAKFFYKQGAKIIITDIKPGERLKSSMEKLEKFKGIKYVLGQHRPEDFTKVNLVIKGPGVPGNSKYLEMARRNEVLIDTEAGVFFEMVKSPVVGVTGTRGKSTTTQLVYEIFKTAGQKALLGGNISNKPLLDILEQVKKNYWIVVELSSFQLEGIEQHKKSPKIAVVTNLMKDHLNRYDNTEDYHKAKETIVRYQTSDDYAVLNYDDEKLREWASRVKSKVWFFSMNRLGGSRVVFVSEGRIWIKVKEEQEELIELNKIKIIGKHRIYNIMAAAAAALAAGIKLTDIKKAVESFKGLEHRLEVIEEKDGVIYVNDTTATTPEAAVNALDSFKSSVFLIAGGSDKGLDFNDMAKKIIEKVKGLILLPGKGTDRLVKFLRKNIPEEIGEYEFKTADNMEQAVRMAASEAGPGEVVLLSPGCASFGMFENEFERGEAFKQAVEEL